MKRLMIKLLLAAGAFLAVNLWMCGRAAQKGASHWLVSLKFEETALFILLQAAVAVIFLVRPLETKKQKTVYLCIAETLVLITVLFWGVIVVGPIWFR